MKQYGLLGKGTGKLGSSVFAISGGEQIVREYNPKVSNPNTTGQMQQRAKFKLLSQLAVVFAPYLGFGKIGLKSARNQFVSRNFENLEWDESVGAMCSLHALQLTGGNRLLSGVTITPDLENDRAKVSINASAADDNDAFVIITAGEEDRKAKILASMVVKSEDVTPGTPIEIFAEGTAPVCLVYGIKYPSSGSTVNYPTYQVEDGTQVAILNYVHSLIRSGAEFSATKGMELGD